MNGRCVVTLPIAEPGSFGDTIKIKASSREPSNPGWTVIPVRPKFQPILQDIADDIVVPLGVDNQANLENNRVYITNNREWSKEQKHRIVEIDYQERRKGTNFMKRIKRRWGLEFSESKRTAQNLVDNGRILKKEGWGNMGEQEELMTEQTKLEICTWILQPK